MIIKVTKLAFFDWYLDRTVKQHRNSIRRLVAYLSNFFEFKINHLIKEVDLEKKLWKFRIFWLEIFIKLMIINKLSKNRLEVFFMI